MHDVPCCCDSVLFHPRPLGRRLFSAGFAAAGLLATHAALAADPVIKTVLTPDQALQVLKDGNDRFVTDAPYRAAQDRERRLELARGQAPFCVLVGCSDSRVPPELLFGRGLGELFIIRNAGNTVDTAALGSIEYGVGVTGLSANCRAGPRIMRCGRRGGRCGREKRDLPRRDRRDDPAHPPSRAHRSRPAWRPAG